MVDQSEARGTRRSVLISVSINLIEALGLGIAASLSGSLGLRAQTADNVAASAVGLFLCIGVFSSARPTDDTHPLGYGRELFFWSLFAALGIFVGGGGLALEGALQSAIKPATIGSYSVSYLVLGVTVLLDSIALFVSIPPLRQQALDRHLTIREHLRRNSDPALTTVVVSGGCAILGGFVAMVGLLLSEFTGSTLPDSLAGGLIGLLLLATSAFLLKTNRELLTGRGVSSATLAEMKHIVTAQAGVAGVPDLFAVFVGPSSIIVNGDVLFAEGLTVSAVELAIIQVTAALRSRWPSIEFVYLTPVPLARLRRVRRPIRKAKF